MANSPAQPKIYHITHGRNLARIIADGCLWSDEEIVVRGGPEAPIGIPDIKKRRLEDLNVDCRPGTKVGQYVPFYFCPRSVMLYILHRGNLPGLTYKEGQRPILHLEADLQEVVAWAEAKVNLGRSLTGTRVASTSSPSGIWTQLDQLNWGHIDNPDFRDPLVKEAKQAEFLVFGSFPWTLVRTIGVIE